jgi:hypothetical protein
MRLRDLTDRIRHMMAVDEAPPETVNEVDAFAYSNST